ncbi:hypothetical protein BB8028_0004g11380 [Beauveria bassiana]|uniref:BTB domain-containing protein n=1 Tax=Beauveria bassiana TaxID=176275 RepID=A0A2S7YDG7_BEABA|nr:hypothetical protein BB8028_0004g11380 [Beauveria bassiana]
MGTLYEAIEECGDLLLILRPRTKPLAWQVETTGTEPQTPQNQVLESTKNPAGDVNDEESHGDDAEIQPEHKFLVSSHILRHASQVFRKDLDPSGPWRQPEIQPDGLRHKNLDGFDPKALKHVLDLIHFRNDRVPDKLEMEELAEVAVIVDYFQCHEAMRFVVKSWIREDRIKEVIDEAQPGRPLFLWLLIAYVFGIDAITNAAAKTIIENNRGPFDSMELPFSESITSRMNNARETIIQRLLENIYQFKDTLSTDKVSECNPFCEPVCEILALGGLQRKLCSTGLYPRPEKPFYGVCVSDVNSMIETYLKLMVSTARPCSYCGVRKLQESLDSIEHMMDYPEFGKYGGYADDSRKMHTLKRII